MSLWDFQANRVFDTDKRQNYLDVYDAIIGPLREQPITLLELGINRGGSLKMWSDYLPKAQIFGIDLVLPETEYPDNVKVAVGDQSSAVDLRAALDDWGCETFDVIIDDASHLGHLTAASFAHLFHMHLKPGGHYFIEDWGTGYWPDWPDGSSPDAFSDGMSKFTEAAIFPPFDKEKNAHLIESHQAGVVGFVKLLIDVMSAPDIVTQSPSLIAPRERIAAIDIRPGVAVVRKAD